MARFFFDLRDSRGWYQDRIGEVLDTVDDACIQAQALLSDIAGDEMPAGDDYRILCEVRDEGDRIVYRGTLTYEGVQF